MPRANCKPSEPMPLAKLPLSMCSAAVKAIAEKVVRLPQNPTNPSISLGGAFAPLCQTATTPPSRALPKTLTISTPCGSVSSTPHRAKAPNSPPKATNINTMISSFQLKMLLNTKAGYFRYLSASFNIYKTPFRFFQAQRGGLSPTAESLEPPRIPDRPAHRRNRLGHHCCSAQTRRQPDC